MQGTVGASRSLGPLASPRRRGRGAAPGRHAPCSPGVLRGQGEVEHVGQPSGQQGRGRATVGVRVTEEAKKRGRKRSDGYGFCTRRQNRAASSLMAPEAERVGVFAAEDGKHRTNQRLLTTGKPRRLLNPHLIDTSKVPKQGFQDARGEGNGLVSGLGEEVFLPHQSLQSPGSGLLDRDSVTCMSLSQPPRARAWTSLTGLDRGLPTSMKMGGAHATLTSESSGRIRCVRWASQTDVN